MAVDFAELIGRVIHWLIHGCKTSLQDEVEGNLDATWGRMYDMENYIIGVVTVVIILVIVLLLVFLSSIE
jgi:hypothetical protein